MLLDRADIETALSDLVHRLAEHGERATISLVGGAALALRYFDRDSTRDVDGIFRPSSAVNEIAEEIARERGWSPGWLNDDVKNSGGLPFARVEWVTIYDVDDLVVQVASARMLLAMRLKAGRPARDSNDIAMLLTICGVPTAEDAEELFEEFYPGELPREST